MEIIFEIIFQLIFEVVFQTIAQLLIEVGLGRFVVWLKTKVEGDRVLLGTLYFLFGLILGGFSQFLFPEPIIKNYVVKALYFILSPILIGLSLCFFSWVINGKSLGDKFFKIEKFAFGFIFAVAFSLTRFYFNL